MAKATVTVKRGNIWKTVALLGIGYAINDIYKKNPPFGAARYKHPHMERLKDIAVDKFADMLGVKNNTSRVSYRHNDIFPRVRYDDRYTLYKDAEFNSEFETDTFIKSIEKLFNDQGGYITALQYMGLAGNTTQTEQNHYGWTSLSGIRKEKRKKKWCVLMPFPKPLDI